MIEHPIRPTEGACAVVARKPGTGGQWDDQCDQPPVWRARWRFDYPGRRVETILLCDEHRWDLAGNDRLTDVWPMG
jgi:hypothetical protein